MKSRQPRGHLIDHFQINGRDFPRALSWCNTLPLLAFGTADGSWGIIDAMKKEMVHSQKLPSAVTSLEWHPSEHLVAVASEDGVCRVYGSLGQLKFEVPASNRRLWAENVTWSEDGRFLAVSAGKHARVFHSNGTPLLETEAHPSTITGMAFLRNGGGLVSICYGGARVWPLAEGAPSRHLPFKGSLISLEISPNSEVIACGSQDASVHFWRLLNGKDSEMTGFPQKPRELAFSADSLLLATGGGPAICVWNFEGNGPEGTKPYVLKGHEEDVSCLHFAPSAPLLASGGRDHDVLLWKPRQNFKPIGLAQTTAPVTHLCFHSKFPLLAAANEEGVVEIWNVVEE